MKITNCLLLLYFFFKKMHLLLKNNWLYVYDQKIIHNLFLSQLKKEVPDDFKRQHYIDYFFKNPNKRWHKFHIVSPSPWPFFLSMDLLLFILHFVSLLYRDRTALFGFYVSFLILLAVVSLWFRDIIREATYMGYHTLEVQMIHRTGFVLFLVSEVMIFFGFFWAYFHFALSPSIFSGNIWPPEGIVFFFISEDVIASGSLKIWCLLGYDEKGELTEGILDFCGSWFKNVVARINRINVKDTDEKRIIATFMYLAYFYENTNFFFFSHFNFLEWRISPKYYFPFCFDRDAYFFNFYNINPQNYDVGKIYHFSDDKIFDFNKIFYINILDSGALINPFHIPLLNTMVLLTSGCILMAAHTCLRLRDYLYSIILVAVTISFAIFFILCQAYEYCHAAFSINDGSFGSSFYMLTGLHGFHVIVGTIFLIVCFFRLIFSHFTSTNHFGFEAAIWYWHFVDVVRIFLYIFVYVWPNMYYFFYDPRVWHEGFYHANLDLFIWGTALFDIILTFRVKLSGIEWIGGSYYNKYFVYDYEQNFGRISVWRSFLIFQATNAILTRVFTANEITYLNMKGANLPYVF